MLHSALAPLSQREAQVLSFSLVVKREYIVSPPRLTLSNQEDPMSLWSRALDQVSSLDPRDGTMEPGIREQEVVCLLGDRLGHGEGDGGVAS